MPGGTRAGGRAPGTVATRGRGLEQTRAHRPSRSCAQAPGGSRYGARTDRRPVSPASAPRPPICRLRSCEGRNPRTTACEDPTTVASHTAADGTRLEIRRSAACQAGWIRARPTHPGFRIRLTSPGTPSGQAPGTTWSADLEPVNTTMIAAPRASRLRACYYPTADRPDRECFGGTGDVPSP
ncbi:DUF2690 domain-containing protein [Streptomyces sioyaensis]|uniref:DUF2690 domain-containing protein n=1 Tax=Streptomyces sioyaensis TaxID=67364 RepID=UPI001F29433F|nr:DUF2690 domain-containing protein [Streptomyces sioyaensis]